jgi:hypothetical protein
MDGGQPVFLPGAAQGGLGRLGQCRLIGLTGKGLKEKRR